ncbi:uncharacterized protein PGTG_16487 [Puccinia graminis f. sp. tritici CRL 75-36-700-3]|uniref:Uncharacterized protein n=1 Tax=Puccinia graminis f. sp. tritici (strain CRL 75-36-700-3 / race SCCL) TaxID=418459 RepID=E3L0Y4_PUCGT|nr:uncharacterized protein PGTG_16487 [Puccinia graminis f. sp. tritici CRL 75-36-700-3]EFP90209.1 hypothetical protein PGTG_16487 [Puccinia graminis f. sp. tritici CRL 75-36-700-3]
MDGRTDSSDLQELERELESGRQRIKLYELENQKLQASIQGLKSKVNNQSSFIRALLVPALSQAIPPLQAGRDTHRWRDRIGFGRLDLRLERELLPRLRRGLVKMTHALQSTRLEELHFSEDPVTEIAWLEGIVKDAHQLKSSVLQPWHHSHTHFEFIEATKTMGLPNFSQIDQNANATYILEPYYYRELPWGVDYIRDGIIKLFKIHIKALQAEDLNLKPDKSGETALGEVLRLIDQMIWDFEHPRKVLQLKWQRTVREIEIMELAVIQSLKPLLLQNDTGIEGISNYKHLKLDRWTPRELMSQSEVELLENYLPLLKLCRMMLNKLCSPASNEPQLILRIRTEGLREMYYETEAIEDDIRKFTYTVLRLRSKKAVVRVRDYLAGFRFLLTCTQTHLQSFLEQSDAGDPALIQNSLEWCEMWTDQFTTAIHNFSRGPSFLFDSDESLSPDSDSFFDYDDDSSDEEEEEDDDDDGEDEDEGDDNDNGDGDAWRLHLG